MYRNPCKFAQAAMLLACTQEVPSSNLGQDYPDRGFSWLYLVRPDKFPDIT
jgi:hypothetical protein